MQLKFLEFLKRNQVLLYFRRNVINNSQGVIQGELSLIKNYLIIEISPPYWIESAFDWDYMNDPEFWDELNDKWQNELKIMEN